MNKKTKVIKNKKPTRRKVKLTLRQKIADTYYEEKPLFFDGFDDAILGIDEETYRVIYSVKKALAIIYKETTLTKKDLTEEEIKDGVTVKDRKMEMTIEHFEFNVLGTKGERMPIWCDNDF